MHSRLIQYLIRINGLVSVAWIEGIATIYRFENDCKAVIVYLNPSEEYLWEEVFCYYDPFSG